MTKEIEQPALRYADSKIFLFKSCFYEKGQVSSIKQETDIISNLVLMKGGGVKIYNKAGGFTLIEIMIVVGVIGLLAAIALPNLNKAGAKAMRGACIANLRQIDGATTLYATNEGADPTGIADLVPDYIPRTPECPAGGSYKVGAIFADPDDPTAPTCDFGNGHEI